MHRCLISAIVFGATLVVVGGIFNERSLAGESDPDTTVLGLSEEAAFVGPQLPSEPLPAPELEDVTALGEFLFFAPELSASNTVSCSDCHDPQHALADHTAQSIGILELPVGKNSPTLHGLTADSHFPTAGRRGRIIAADLAKRCLAPLENPLEMGSSINDSVNKIRTQLPWLDKTADRVFGGRGVGLDYHRVGEALAKYIESLSPPTTRYTQHLAGDTDALSAEEREGLAIFEGKAQCSTCHSGPTFSDGLVHAVTSNDSDRITSRRRAALAQRLKLIAIHRTGKTPIRRTPKRRSRAAIGAPHPGPVDTWRSELARKAISTRGYGASPSPLERTPSLWEVTDTAPYFRDGSEWDLSEAIRTHVKELQHIGPENRSFGLLGTLPRELQPPWTHQPRSRVFVPTLDDDEIESVIRFLDTLSPDA